ncbi:MAG: NAD(P)-dependent glycerol-3-phosphate dehydrogenase [Halobacteriovoraceae bacterium]|nr:NAD(P)-dependent glycerol-3-phosphate dehydrogenase [Halobacteriovoraceae bacterium]MCB9095665.1 NAD(P)-dependent glycerol-3-phosphate dehydrogenase [Halobacteriovoraceae bacterium]
MKKTKFNSVLIIGAGAFGTSMACVLAHNFKNVYLKVRSQDIYDCLKQGENSIYLPGLTLPSNIYPLLEWDEVDKIGDVQLLVSGLPTKVLTDFYTENKERIIPFLDKKVPFVSLSKGIDTETLELPDDIFYDIFYLHKDLFTFLSGPSFAKEIVEKQVTLVSLAGKSRQVLEKVAKMTETSYFRSLPTYDVKGVLLGGALKNILAIAGGIIEGLGYNHNTRAAMITRGIVEMLRFGKVFNARPESFYGLSGMGDLILTTTGELSRNKSFGIEIAKGRKPDDIIKSARYVVEGYKTTKAAFDLAKKYKIRIRLFDGIYRILYQGEDPQQIIEEMMNLPMTFEE